ncbi:hypothetical protein BCR39DRAFT_560511 [Naematelia encephala]|uniref:Uncharacterized protein n=1 Tax=Naematelia encephala TaxID=71784 RepID=A0A1Y2AVA3_9TREE|nr:hypothetical protein BCR39DRAFT_560511 [Naematelia encephala]
MPLYQASAIDDDDLADSYEVLMILCESSAADDDHELVEVSNKDTYTALSDSGLDMDVDPEEDMSAESSVFVPIARDGLSDDGRVYDGSDSKVYQQARTRASEVSDNKTINASSSSPAPNTSQSFSAPAQSTKAGSLVYRLEDPVSEGRCSVGVFATYGCEFPYQSYVKWYDGRSGTVMLESAEKAAEEAMLCRGHWDKLRSASHVSLNSLCQLQHIPASSQTAHCCTWKSCSADGHEWTVQDTSKKKNYTIDLCDRHAYRLARGDSPTANSSSNHDNRFAAFWTQPPPAHCGASEATNIMWPGDTLEKMDDGLRKKFG